MNKDYSVLMSVYCKEQPCFLARSIESVMQQTIPPSDFLIVCDGVLTKELYDVINNKKKKYRCIRVLYQNNNMGLGESLNNGLSHIENDIVMRMDSDDVCLPERAEIQLSYLDEFDLVGSWVSEFENDEINIIGIRAVPEKYDEIIKFSKLRNPFNHPSVMFKKEVVVLAGNYQQLLFFEDYYLWLRVLKKTKKVMNIQKVLVNMRSGYLMRSRRGGKEYRKSLIALRKYMLHQNIINWFEYVFYSLGQIAFSCLPIKIKDFLYRRKLRK